MIKSFSGQVAIVLLSVDPYLLTLAKTDYPSIQKLKQDLLPLDFTIKVS